RARAPQPSWSCADSPSKTRAGLSKWTAPSCAPAVRLLCLIMQRIEAPANNPTEQMIARIPFRFFIFAFGMFLPGAKSTLDPLLLRIPLDSPVLFQRQVAQMRGARGFDRDADIRRRRLAALHAVEEVADVRDRSVAARFDQYLRLHLSQLAYQFAAFRVNGQILAVEFHCRFCSANLQPAVVNAAGHRAVISDAETLRIIERAGDRVGAFPFERVAIAAGHDADRRGHAHVPVRDVNPVRHQVGQRAPAEIPEPAPPEKLDRSDGLPRSASEPHLLVEFVER